MFINLKKKPRGKSQVASSASLQETRTYIRFNRLDGATFRMVQAFASTNIRVTAIVSAYCSESFINGCLQALVRQSLFERKELEVLIVDANSPENEGAIVQRYIRDHCNIRYIRNEQRTSLYEVWNQAASVARGDYLLMASADDRLFPRSSQLLADALDESPNAALAYGDWVHASPDELAKFDSQGLIPDRKCRAGEFKRTRLLRCHYLGSQIMWRKDDHARVGGFSLNYDIASDLDFAFRLTKKRAALYLGIDIGIVTRHEKALSSNRSQTENERSSIIESHFREVLESQIDAPERTISSFLADCLTERPPWREGKPEVFVESYMKALKLARERGLLNNQLIKTVEQARRALLGELEKTPETIALTPGSRDTVINTRQFLKDYFGHQKVSAFEKKLSEHPDALVMIWGGSAKGGLVKSLTQLNKRTVHCYIDSRKRGTFNNRSLHPPEFLRSFDQPLFLVVAMNPAYHSETASRITELNKANIAYFHI
ncbi:glycosyltransferase family A protein [Pelagicoccus sp. SDUM812003]|uniref:glycosyltransferase family 2 protein n=1 Tax=Pelagicoccus sp. SDUM812003 TaxID=3041267 RepID=UPI00280FB472|nr:glycosyltransferase family A protein [Pelagicoccus sp. SDUM812003]MDQ8201574.1 glycosyltransferase family A protein [Pelagicoccus sp. SDUM812003]